MKRFEVDHSLTYWIAVWILPAVSVVLALTIALFVDRGMVQFHWLPRAGAVCVATGAIAESYLLAPRFVPKGDQFVATLPPPRSRTLYRWEEFILRPQILFGTGLWAFGDLMATI